MQIIHNTTDLEGRADPTLTSILDRYADLMDLATLFIIEPGDTLSGLALARGWSCEDWEFVTDHGGWLEAVFIISDDGAGHVVLAPDRPGIDSDLLALFQAHACPAEGDL